MNFIKRMSIFTLIVLLFVSLYQDMVKDIDHTTTGMHDDVAIESRISTSFQVVKAQIQPGDTVLSINEQINPNDRLHVDQIIEDFKLLNPFTDPYELQVNKLYYFPRYNDTS